MTPTYPPAIPDQTGRTWLVTGATNGIGLAAASAASAAGARLIIPARDVGRAEAVAASLPGKALVARMDLLDLDSVRAFAATVDEPIDVLLNNAGGISRRKAVTRGGVEILLATNLLGPFALTNLVADRVRGRIVIVGSDTHGAGRLSLDDPAWERRRWSLQAAYAQSKLADMLWARELQRRLADAGSGVEVQMAHPGWAVTNIQNATGNRYVDRVVTALCRVVGQSAEAGSLPLLHAATADLPRLSYVGPDGFRKWRGSPEEQRPKDVALDDAAAREVWDFAARHTATDLHISE